MDWLEEIAQRWAKTTPGPWAVNDNNEAGDLYVGRAGDKPNWFGIVILMAYGCFNPRVREDAAAIAAAPADIARLVAEVKRLRAARRPEPASPRPGWPPWVWPLYHRVRKQR